MANSDPTSPPPTTSKRGRASFTVRGAVMRVSCSSSGPQALAVPGSRRDNGARNEAPSRHVKHVAGCFTLQGRTGKRYSPTTVNAEERNENASARLLQSGGGGRGARRSGGGAMGKRSRAAPPNSAPERGW